MRDGRRARPAPAACRADHMNRQIRLTRDRKPLPLTRDWMWQGEWDRVGA
ncbi:hypothetical protein [Paracraurococcus lichenis]|uniref:Uncharacterized protein n=1 Tax=Paracraurococcus lichenis TaxID=3064888 RepID=A0ABT9E296_9PROT|nr:hypothetical protein [Paracraurococcus sp. LOR1-02]MDO9710289.1 hypothetical protein [Paracraurococcus sp. LOR1-02]